MSLSLSHYGLAAPGAEELTFLAAILAHTDQKLLCHRGITAVRHDHNELPAEVAPVHLALFQTVCSEVKKIDDKYDKEYNC